MTTGWFQRATAAFSRPEPVVQLYEVRCDCGQQLTGQRVPAAQKPSCPACGTTLFVLPATPYPLPASLLQKTDAEPAAPAPATRKGKSVAPATNRKKAADRGKAAPPPVPVPQQDRLKFWLAQATPIRILAVVICGALVLMSTIIIQRARWSHAQEALQSAVDRGNEALTRRDLVVAAAEFGDAAHSLDILRRFDPTARQLRRTAQETRVSTELLAKPIMPPLVQWLANPGSDAPIKELTGNGQWIVFDAELSPLAAEEVGGQQPMLLDIPWLAGETPVDVIIEGQPWEALWKDNGNDVPRRAIFAAKLARGERPTEKHPAARLWLDSDSAVLWSDERTLDALGLLGDETSRETARAQLSRQQSFLEQQR